MSTPSILSRNSTEWTWDPHRSAGVTCWRTASTTSLRASLPFQTLGDYEALRVSVNPYSGTHFSLPGYCVPAHCVHPQPVRSAAHRVYELVHAEMFGYVRWDCMKNSAAILCDGSETECNKSMGSLRRNGNVEYDLGLIRSRRRMLLPMRITIVRRRHACFTTVSVEQAQVLDALHQIESNLAISGPQVIIRRRVLFLLLWASSGRLVAQDETYKRHQCQTDNLTRKRDCLTNSIPPLSNVLRTKSMH